MVVWDPFSGRFFLFSRLIGRCRSRDGAVRRAVGRLLAVFQHELAVDDDVDDSRAVLERLEVGGLDRSRSWGRRRSTSAIEPGAEQAAIEQPDLGGVERRHFAHGVFEASASLRLRTYSPRTRGNVPKLRGWG